MPGSYFMSNQFTKSLNKSQSYFISYHFKKSPWGAKGPMGGVPPPILDNPANIWIFSFIISFQKVFKYVKILIYISILWPLMTCQKGLKWEKYLLCCCTLCMTGQWQVLTASKPSSDGGGVPGMVHQYTRTRLRNHCCGWWWWWVVFYNLVTMDSKVVQRIICFLQPDIRCLTLLSLRPGCKL